MDSIQPKGYNFNKIKDLLKSIPNVQCFDQSKVLVKSTLNTPDIYIWFEHSELNFKTPIIMVCFTKLNFNVSCGLIYPEVIGSIEKFLNKIGKQDLISKLSDCLININDLTTIE